MTGNQKLSIRDFQVQMVKTQAMLHSLISQPTNKTLSCPCKLILNSIKFINRDRPGSDLAAGVAAAFAAYSLVDEDDSKEYLISARSLLDFAIKYEGKN